MDKDLIFEEVGDAKFSPLPLSDNAGGVKILIKELEEKVVEFQAESASEMFAISDGLMYLANKALRIGICWHYDERNNK